MGFKRLLTLAVVVVLIIVLHYTRILEPVEQGILRITNPIIRSVSRLGTRLTTLQNYFAQKKELVTRVETLETALEKAEQNSANRQLLEEENQELRTQLEFKKRSGYRNIIAYVVGKTIDNTANTIIIDKGSIDGIGLFSAVIVGDGILVGKIAKVGPHTSIVRLINDPQSKIAATVLNGDRSIGIIEGGFGISVNLTNVIQQENLEVGTLIVTSGLEENVPRGLLIGTLQSIHKEDYKPFQEGVIEPAASLSRLTVVGVIQFDQSENNP